MRKISELFGADNGAATISREELDGGTAVAVEYRIQAPGVDRVNLIEDFYEAIDYPRSTMQAGNLAHFSGTAGAHEWLITEIWDSERHAREMFATIGTLIEDVFERNHAKGTVERVSHGVHRVSIGENVNGFSSATTEVYPECVGFLIDIPLHGKLAYDMACEQMGFPENFPEGLLMHTAGETDRGWRTCSVWRTVEDSRVFMEERVMPAAVQFVRSRGVVPEIRPRRIRPFIFALNERMLAS